MDRNGRKEYNRKWRAENKEYIRKYMQEWLQKHKEYMREYRVNNKEHIRELMRDKPYQKNYLRRIRNSVLEALGAKCVKCGFGDKRALQIDHINGGGTKERKQKLFKGHFHKHVLKSFLAKESKYQLLCANCNWIKKFENNEIK